MYAYQPLCRCVCVFVCPYTVCVPCVCGTSKVRLCLLIFHNEIILETCEQCGRKTRRGSGAAQLGSRPSTLAGTIATALVLLLPGPLIIREAPSPGLGKQRRLGARHPPSLWQPTGLFIFLSHCLPPWGYHLDSTELIVSKPKLAQTLIFQENPIPWMGGVKGS